MSASSNIQAADFNQFNQLSSTNDNLPKQTENNDSDDLYKPTDSSASPTGEAETNNPINASNKVDEVVTKLHFNEVLTPKLTKLTDKYNWLSSTIEWNINDIHSINGVLDQPFKNFEHIINWLRSTYTDVLTEHTSVKAKYQQLLNNLKNTDDDGTLNQLNSELDSLKNQLESLPTLYNVLSETHNNLFNTEHNLLPEQLNLKITYLKEEIDSLIEKISTTATLLRDLRTKDGDFIQLANTTSNLINLLISSDLYKLPEVHSTYTSELKDSSASSTGVATLDPNVMLSFITQLQGFYNNIEPKINEFMELDKTYENKLNELNPKMEKYIEPMHDWITGVIPEIIYVIRETRKEFEDGSTNANQADNAITTLEALFKQVRTDFSRIRNTYYSLLEEFKTLFNITDDKILSNFSSLQEECGKLFNNLEIFEKNLKSIVTSFSAHFKDNSDLKQLDFEFDEIMGGMSANDSQELKNYSERSENLDREYEEVVVNILTILSPNFIDLIGTASADNTDADKAGGL